MLYLINKQKLKDLPKTEKIMPASPMAKFLSLGSTDRIVMMVSPVRAKAAIRLHTERTVM